MRAPSYQHKDQLLDIKFLRLNAIKIHAFGLGFIQIKLSQNHRLHVYCPEVVITTGDEDVHDHRYDFVSEVLKGDITNSLYSLDMSQNTHLLILESCDPKKPVANKTKTPCGLIELSTFTVKAQGSYSLQKDTLHRVKTSRAITFLTRENPIKEFARVVQKKGQELICPFSVNLDETELWKLVEREIRDTY